MPSGTAISIGRNQPSLDGAWGVDQSLEHRLDGGEQRTAGAVERSGTLSAGAGEVEGDLVALDLHLDLHGNLLVAEPVAVDQILRRIDTIGQRRDGRAADLLALGHEVRKSPADGLRAILAAHLLEAGIGDADGGNLGIEIAQGHFRQPDVGRDQVEQVVLPLALAKDAESRKAQPFVEDFRRLRRNRAGNAAADLGPMRDGDAEREQLVIDEYRLHDADVGEMRAPAIGVVDHIDVTGPHPVAELADHRLNVPLKGAREDGDAVGLGDELRLVVADPACEIEDLVDDRRHAGARQHQAHLVGRGLQLSPNDFQCDRIVRAPCGAGVYHLTRLPTEAVPNTEGARIGPQVARAQYLPPDRRVVTRPAGVRCRSTTSSCGDAHAPHNMSK